MGKEFKFVSGKEKEKIRLFGGKFPAVDNFRGELNGNTEFVLEGCRGVLEFSDYYIKLNLQKGNIILTGKNFDICGFEDDTLTVTGIIDSIEFCISGNKNV